MSRPLVIRAAARTEFAAAALWYEQQRRGRGVRFSAAVRRVFDAIRTNPFRYPVGYKGVREGLVNRFPYCVHYREEQKQIVVLAVYHTSRDPSGWHSRV